jgi:hypothetical protein
MVLSNFTGTKEEDGWLISYRNGQQISKTKLSGSGGSKKSLAQQTNMSRKAATSEEKSLFEVYAEKGMKIMGLSD